MLDNVKRRRWPIIQRPFSKRPCLPHTATSALPKQVDVLIIGAGLSGIGMASRLKIAQAARFTQSPLKASQALLKDQLLKRVLGGSTRLRADMSVLMVEARDHLGGTWDLFKYPGVRSDSDMSTYSYQFRPWTDGQTLASGAAILQYLHDTVAEYDLLPNMRFGKKVTQLNWSSRQKAWQVTLEDTQTGQSHTLSAKFVIAATGYYDYTGGYRPDFPNEDKFAGDIIHPQHWPADYDYRNKNVVVIGSGATAVTLVPAMAEKAAHVTMLQRSPTYIASVPSHDPGFEALKNHLPLPLAVQLNRAKNVAMQQVLFQVAKRVPRTFRQVLLYKARQDLKGVSKKTATIKDFAPRYNPWDERLCAVPDGDLFQALQSGKASVVTDTIKHFDKTGIKLASGKHLPADVVVTATGLKLQMLGGIKLAVDDQPIDIARCMTYKGVLVNQLPNFAVLFGYINASWTIKTDLASRYLCRLLSYLQQQRFEVVTPVASDTQLTEETVMGGLQSGYIRRAQSVLPKQGKTAPWRVTHRYPNDIKQLTLQPLLDDYLKFER